MNDRLPPHSPESETAILGCCLLDNACIDACSAVLPANDSIFYDLRNQAIFAAMAEMRNAGKLVETITLYTHLKNSGTAEQVGGMNAISQLPDAVATAANVSEYLQEVVEKHLLRKMIHVCTDAIGRVYDDGQDVDGLIAELERSVLAIRPIRKAGSLTVKELVRQAITNIEDMWQRQGRIDGIETGFTDLDKLTGGLHSGEMTVIAGYPGAGKTSFAMNIAEHAMLNCGKKVGVFSLEMSAVGLVTRCICSHASVNLRNVKDGFLADADFPKLTGAAGKIANAKIYFEDDSDISIYQLRASARRMWQQYGIEMLVIDYLQLLTAIGGSRKAESRQQEVADISRGVKAMSRELNIPVIALSQLNDDGKLRESRAIGQDADNVWILKPGEKEDDSDAVPVDLRIAKARNGPVGLVRLTFLKSFTRFQSASKVTDETDNRNPYND